jgi:hypothetical protein
MYKLNPNFVINILMISFTNWKDKNGMPSLNMWPLFFLLCGALIWSRVVNLHKGTWQSFGFDVLTLMSD